MSQTATQGEAFPVDVSGRPLLIFTLKIFKNSSILNLEWDGKDEKKECPVKLHELVGHLHHRITLLQIHQATIVSAIKDLNKIIEENSSKPAENNT